MDFRFMGWRQRAQQSFDKENITITKAGETYNVYQRIQENTEDTEIYPTLEKYGCIDKLGFDANKTYEDFTVFGGLREIKEQQMKANEMFYKLPLETRQKFNNDKNVYMRDGMKWVKSLIDEEKAKAKAAADALKKAEQTISTSQTTTKTEA